MKSYTNIEQSKKLVDILPRESADMGWYYSKNPYAARNQMWVGTKVEGSDIPCWSLTALLNILPSSTLDSSDDHYYRVRCKERFTEWHDNAVDACIEMILKLHEQMIVNFDKNE